MVNGVKGILEQRAFIALEKHLNEREKKTLKGLPALQTTAVDRYGMGRLWWLLVWMSPSATSCSRWACLLRLKSCLTIRLVAAILLPILTRVPYEWLYPLGATQD